MTILVSAAALPAELVKEMPPTVSPAKAALSWTRGCAGKPAPRGTWPWTGCASAAQRCVRTASMRKHAKVPRSLTGERVGAHYLRVGCPRSSGGNHLHAFTEIDLYGGQWENWGWHKAFSWWILQIKTDKSPFFFFFTRFLLHTSWAVRVWQALSQVLEIQTRTQSFCCSDHKTSWERLILTKHRGGWRISTVTKYTKVRIRQL